MKLVPKNIDAFLRFDDVVTLDGQIRAKTNEIAGSDIEAERALAIFNWVRDEILHSRDFGYERVTCSSSETMSHGTGICFAKSHLMASMMRHAGIPCGFCYQVFENLHAQSSSKLALHGLNAIYLQSTGSWLRVDPRGNRSDITTIFSLDSESLAFPDMHFLNDCIYASPLTAVIDTLKAAESITSLWPHLPSVSNTGES